MTLTIEQLRQFIAVAKNLNFSRGADELFLHQSTVSKNIAAMETELGGPLFVRKKNDLQLTDAGKLLYNEAPMMVGKFNFLIERTKKVMSGTSGNLRLAGLSNYVHVLSPIFREFNAQYPSIEFGISEFGRYDMSALWESVLDGSHDLALIPMGELPEGADEDFEKRLFFRDNFVVLVSDSHPLSSRTQIKAAELSGETVLLPSHMRMTPLELINSELFTNGRSEMTIQVTDTVQDPQPISHLLLQVDAGCGIAIVPRLTAVGSGWQGNCIEISDLPIPFDVGVIWRKTNRNPSLPMFIDVLCRHLPGEI